METWAMIWITGDTHFGHWNILKYCNRPFASIEEHNEALIKNINDRVQRNDTLYHLGDFSFRSPSAYRERINCLNVCLILGNHDHRWQYDISYGNLFTWTKDFYLLKTGKWDISLMHYRMYHWHRQHHGMPHFFGHSHSKSTGNPEHFSLDVGVDNQNYLPITISEAIEQIHKRIHNRIAL